MKKPGRRVLRHSTDARLRRAADYPITGDALDAIMKGFRSLIDAGFPVPPETTAWVEQCEAVKGRFRKPSPDSSPGGARHRIPTHTVSGD